jgi:hypothetical protein
VAADASLSPEEVLPTLRLRILVELEVAAADGCSGELVVDLPRDYPSSATLHVTCALRGPGASRRANDAVNALLVARVAEAGFGDEAIVEQIMWLQAQGAAQLSEALAGTAPVSAPPSDYLWQRVFYRIDHMIEGKQHKKEAKVVAAAAGLGLRGQLFYGAPAVLVAEGTRSDQAEFARAARSAGKAMRVVESQELAGGAAEARFGKFSTVPSGNLEALRTELAALGLEHKFRLIIGVEG